MSFPEALCFSLNSTFLFWKIDQYDNKSSVYVNLIAFINASLDCLMSFPEALCFSLNSTFLFYQIDHCESSKSSVRVLSSSSTTTTTSSNQTTQSLTIDSEQRNSSSMENLKSVVNIESELSLLKQQIDSLQITVNSMQNESDRKERALATLAKEKERLTIDLKKQKRSNNNLKQQLDDERTFYYKEKEHYCNEMNNFKKLKQKITNRKDNNTNSSSKVKESSSSINNGYKMEISQLKNTLNQTLEANYNLSVKFLRMKNTKLNLKHQLSHMKRMHESSMENYQEKLDQIQMQLNELVNEQFHKPIPPSNKKYLLVIKQNAGLMHENLNLQLEINRLYMQLDRIKMIELRHETNSKLKLIHHDPPAPPVVVVVDKQQNDSKSSQHEAKSNSNNNNKTKSASIRIEDEPSPPVVPRTAPTTTPRYESTSTNAHSNDGVKMKEEMVRRSNNNNHIYKEIDAQLELMTVSNSNVSSVYDSEYYDGRRAAKCDAYRTQSAPEVVQTVSNVT